ncbi:MAG: RdgB/HAM1 family non-canonical purine NTP pyrophosphatase [Proteobacteria bacterium]|nr:RdgB/HAM1 family non-canonical purine NTP pyrophosphatase [Pseudomonadota bacterium]
MKIVLATENQGKLKEIQSFLQNLPITLLSQAEFEVPPIAETGLTFVENALIKARHASTYTKFATLADDSGLVVNALKGQPGIYSARFAGNDASCQANIEKLLKMMTNFSEEDRTAHFYCSLVYMKHPTDPAPIICQAKWEGYILDKPLGKGGFGYDPIFYIPALKRSAAQLSLAEKNTLSHRAQALSLFYQQFKLIQSA